MGAIGMAAGSQRRRRRLLRLAPAMLAMDMAPRVLAWHAIKVMGTWAPIVLAAQYVDAAQFGGPLEATFAFFIPGLIPILILHLTMFEMLYKDEKYDRRFAEQEVRLLRLEKGRMEDKEIIRKLRDDLKRAGLSQ